MYKYICCDSVEPGQKNHIKNTCAILKLSRITKEPCSNILLRMLLTNRGDHILLWLQRILQESHVDFFVFWLRWTNRLYRMGRSIMDCFGGPSATVGRLWVARWIKSARRHSKQQSKCSGSDGRTPVTVELVWSLELANSHSELCL